MGLHFILGSSGSGKTYTLYHKVIKESIEHLEKNFIILVPEQFTLQTQKDLAGIHPRGGIMNIDVLSFLRLAFRVFEENGGENRTILEDTGKSMIIKKLVLEKQAELRVFGSNTKKRGFIDELKSVISEFYQYSIGQEEISQMLSVSVDKPALYHKLLDIKTIYDAFGNFLKEKYITNEEIFEVLAEELGTSELIKSSICCLDGYTGFTPSQYKLMESLLRHAKEVYITVTIDKRALTKKQLEHQLFYLSSVTIDRLSKIAAKVQCDVSREYIGEDTIPYRYRDSKVLAYLEKNLFRYPYEIYKEEQEDITVFAAKDREEEAEYAAAEIKKLLREGYRYRDIAVISADMAGYGKLLRKKLNHLHIPCFLDEKESILKHPFSELIRAVLAVIQYDYTYDSVMHLLRTGLLDFLPDEIDLLENYIIATGIRGRGRWLSEWKRKYRTSYEILPEEINRLRVKFMDMMEPLSQVFLKKNSVVREWLAALYYFFREQNLEEKLLFFAEEKKRINDTESMILAKEYEQVYRLVLEVFDRIAELLGDDVLPLDEFREIIETGLLEAKVGLIPPGTDQILVGDIERTRLKDIKVLFFMGVNDGLVPKQAAGGGLISEADRRHLFDCGVELAPTLRQTAYMTDFYLYLNLTKPKNKLFLSYYKVDDEGKGVRPSVFIAKLKDMFPALTIITENKDVLGTDYGFSYLARGLRNYREQEMPPVFYELFRLYYSGEIERRKEMENLLSAAFYERNETGISKTAAAALYGNILLGSVTRMEQYASCAFAHFLNFGLNLEERLEYGIAMPDIGNLYHTALELFSKRLKDEGLNWHRLEEEYREELTIESVREAVKDFGNGILESSSRNAYLVKKVERILNRTTKTIKEQIMAGKFEPWAYEYGFLHSDRYVRLKGRIDRMDLYEEGGSIYVQVVDYKSGSLKFDLENLYYGLQLQLGVYLAQGLRYVEEQHPGKKAYPAGVFYYNIDDPIVDKSKDWEEKVKKKLAMNGIVNSSPEILPLLDTAFFAEEGGLMASVKSLVIPAETDKDGKLTKRSSAADEKKFQVLLDYVDDIMHEFSKEIMNGEIKVKPYKKNSETACGYCTYSAVCGFDTKLGSRYHNLRQMNGDEIWKSMEEGRSGQKNELDKGTASGNQCEE